jgi:pimeloyl-ACP methyl ester carboxylesterase
VNRAIETRELLSVAVDGVRLQGTYHKPTEEIAPTDRVGLLFLNHGFLPRAAPGDSAVYWCDSLAQSGYPCFRFDLPGLGDSEGDPPPQMLEIVNAGKYAPIVAALLKALVERFHLDGIVIVGHCAGAVTALFTAPLVKDLKGLVLTDPYFFLPAERNKLRVELSHWSSWSRVGALLSFLYYLAKHTRLLVGRNRPPRNANLPLLRCWNQTASAGTPILVLKAPAIRARGLKPRIGEFDYLQYLQEMTSRNSRVSVQFIENTNHSFADIRGRAAVRENVEQWLNSYFPLSYRKMSDRSSTASSRERAYLTAAPR